MRLLPSGGISKIKGTQGLPDCEKAETSELTTRETEVGRRKIRSESSHTRGGVRAKKKAAFDRVPTGSTYALMG